MKKSSIPQSYRISHEGFAQSTRSLKKNYPAMRKFIGSVDVAINAAETAISDLSKNEKALEKLVGSYSVKASEIEQAEKELLQAEKSKNKKTIKDQQKIIAKLDKECVKISKQYDTIATQIFGSAQALQVMTKTAGADAKKM